MTDFPIGRRRVGDGHPCFLVAEVALAHDGSLGAAHAFVDVAARAGMDAVKFQTHLAEAESTLREPFRVPFSRQDATRYAYWQRTAFTEPQWRGLAEHAAERGLEFLSSPFSPEAVDLLERVGMPAWKIGSGEVGNPVLLDRVLQTGKPVLLSSGLSSWAELDAAVARVRARGAPCLVYQCASRYPAPPAATGLSLLAALRGRYGLPVGFSDHSGRPHFGVAAAALGAASVEVHIAFSHESFGPDTAAALTPGELAGLVAAVRDVEAALRAQPDKDAEARALADLRAMFGRSIVARRPLARGTVLAAADLAVKKPAGGLPPDRWPALLGRRLRRDLAADEALRAEDVE